MKFAKGTDKVLTIIYTVFSVLLIATFILLLIYAGNLMNNAGGSIIKAGSYSPDDYTAGYRFMGHLFYGGLSFTASVFLYIIAIYAAFFALPLIIITIFAYVGMALYKKTQNPKHIKRKERKEQEEIIEGQAEADKLEMNASVKGNDIDHVTEAQKQIVRIMKDNKLLNEDIKGIDIDLNF